MFKCYHWTSCNNDVHKSVALLDLMRRFWILTCSFWFAFQWSGALDFSVIAVESLFQSARTDILSLVSNGQPIAKYDARYQNQRPRISHHYDHLHSILTQVTALFITCQNLQFLQVCWFNGLSVCLDVCLLYPQKLRYLTNALSYLSPNLVHINASRSYLTGGYCSSRSKVK